MDPKTKIETRLVGWEGDGGDGDGGEEETNRFITFQEHILCHTLYDSMSCVTNTVLVHLWKLIHDLGKNVLSLLNVCVWQTLWH